MSKNPTMLFSRKNNLSMTIYPTVHGSGCAGSGRLEAVCSGSGLKWMSELAPSAASGGGEARMRETTRPGAHEHWRGAAECRVRLTPQLWRNLTLALWRCMERNGLKIALDPPIDPPSQNTFRRHCSRGWPEDRPLQPIGPPLQPGCSSDVGLECPLERALRLGGRDNTAWQTGWLGPVSTLEWWLPNPHQLSGNPSTPDVVFCHRDLAWRCMWTAGTDLGSNHLPMITTVTMNGQRPWGSGRHAGFSRRQRQPTWGHMWDGSHHGPPGKTLRKIAEWTLQHRAPEVQDDLYPPGSSVQRTPRRSYDVSWNQYV